MLGRLADWCVDTLHAQGLVGSRRAVWMHQTPGHRQTRARPCSQPCLEPQNNIDLDYVEKQRERMFIVTEGRKHLTKNSESKKVRKEDSSKSNMSALKGKNTHNIS